MERRERTTGQSLAVTAVPPSEAEEMAEAELMMAATVARWGASTAKVAARGLWWWQAVAAASWIGSTQTTTAGIPCGLAHPAIPARQLPRRVRTSRRERDPTPARRAAGRKASCERRRWRCNLGCARRRRCDLGSARRRRCDLGSVGTRVPSAGRMVSRAARNALAGVAPAADVTRGGGAMGEARRAIASKGPVGSAER